MLLDVIKQINWVDIFAIILFCRICYISIEKGFLAEIFKLLGTILAIYLSLHYYTALADFIRERAGMKFIPLEFLDFLCFIFLALIGYSSAVILRQAFSRLLKMEAVPYLARWGGLCLGIVRGALLTGLIAFMLFISSVTYIKESVANAYLGKRLVQIAPATYSGIWDGVMSKFIPGEKFNKTSLEVQEKLK